MPPYELLVLVMLLLVGWECHKCSVIFILRFKIRQYFFTSSCSFEGINFVSSLTSRFNIFPASSSSDMAGVFSGDKGGTQRLALIWAGYFSTVKIRFQNLKLFHKAMASESNGTAEPVASSSKPLRLRCALLEQHEKSSHGEPKSTKARIYIADDKFFDVHTQLQLRGFKRW